jgi:F0F1-type ATP synthase gamma subunit
MKPQEIEEVVVYPLKSLQEIQEERAGLAMRETRQVTGIEVLQSPITALYQAFSQKEKNKRLIASYEYADKQKSILQELLRLYVAYDIFYLSETEFDAFISFLNINEDFLKTATEMELVTFVKDKFYHFQLLNKR